MGADPRIGTPAPSGEPWTARRTPGALCMAVRRGVLWGQRTIVSWPANLWSCLTAEAGGRLGWLLFLFLSATGGLFPGSSGLFFFF